MAQIKDLTGPVALRTKGIYKSFGHIKALDDVSIDFPQNRISALVGDNGAGKSTLIKILAGALTPDKGTITVGDGNFDFLTPAQAIKNGIVTVFQDLSLVNCRDVVSNIFLGNERTRAKFMLDKKRMETEAAGLLEHLHIHLPSLRANVGELSGGQRQAVAIARAINQGGHILILDEPTAAMGVKETAQILTLIAQLKARGYTIILISHNMNQVFSLCDRVAVMRGGSVVAQLDTEKTSPHEIIELITGVEKKNASAYKTGT
ncbi:ATP-binding cassette domain-containing protein [Candidatus Formimonas warabiya]|uniref:ABC transporter domain-containing protein n=1 Tax=Formimonas warabiya TaxID=1761012 RepID=A0A3G1KZH5_FORW1|nr:ATP-binding cassette domain-containing protein [Candidatus Formimonas warabiya]ATW27789.1 hypothetical protein DCMF_26250 [Candidatus Formimonas warabiya]